MTDRRDRHPCSACGTRTTAPICTACEIKLDGGRWVPVNGIQHWIPDGETTTSYTNLRRAYLNAKRERYAAPAWWPTPTPSDDPTVSARRLDAALADADAHDDTSEAVA